jgi:hypothetical protein
MIMSLMNNKKKIRKRIRLPPFKIPLDSDCLLREIRKRKIKHFRGIFSRDTLPRPSSRKKLECGIINLDDDRNPGTHWVAYYCKKNISIYHDPLGNVAPPQEVLNYLKKTKIFYNHTATQSMTGVNCGHLCVKFLANMNKNPKIWKLL